MTCAGKCSMCGKLRDRECSCLQRVRNNDPIHPSLAVAEAFITDTRYFGNDALDDAMALIASARRDAIEATSQRLMDGFTCKRIDQDAHRLVERAKGKLYGTRQRLAEQNTNSAKGKKENIQSSRDVIARFKASQG